MNKSRSNAQRTSDLGLIDKVLSLDINEGAREAFINMKLDLDLRVDQLTTKQRAWGHGLIRRLHRRKDTGDRSPVPRMSKAEKKVSKWCDTMWERGRPEVQTQEEWDAAMVPTHPGL